MVQLVPDSVRQCQKIDVCRDDCNDISSLPFVQDRNAVPHIFVLPWRKPNLRMFSFARFLRAGVGVDHAVGRFYHSNVLPFHPCPLERQINLQ